MSLIALTIELAADQIPLIKPNDREAADILAAGIAEVVGSSMRLPEMRELAKDYASGKVSVAIGLKATPRLAVQVQH